MSLPKPSQVLKAQALTLSNIQVPKARRPRFELNLRIIDLNNVPLVSGTCFVKWHLSSSTAADHRGRSKKCPIKDHKVDFDYEQTIPVRLIVGKDQMLQESWLHFEVLQEYSSGGKGERLVLGNIKLNLAEYVEASELNHDDDEEGVTRRYLMQDSKINSTLKIGICMKHVEGDRNYFAPPLKTAPVFGGIAGVMAQEAPEGMDDVGHMPSLSSKSRDAGEMQDMYRRTLAASWVAQPGELRADDCIEDIFAGGDGWGSHLHNKNNPNSRGRDDDDGAEDEHFNSSHMNPDNLAPHDYARSPRSKSPKGSGSSMFGHHHRHSKGNKSIDSKKSGGGFGDWTHAAHSGSGSSGGGSSRHKHSNHGHHGHHGAFGGSKSLHQQAIQMEMQSLRQKQHKTHHKNEIDEFDNPYREDLRGWRVNVEALA